VLLAVGDRLSPENLPSVNSVLDTLASRSSGPSGTAFEWVKQISSSLLVKSTVCCPPPDFASKATRTTIVEGRRP